MIEAIKQIRRGPFKAILFLLLLEIVAGLRDQYRPNPRSAPWIKDTSGRDMYSLSQQEQREFSDNEEITATIESYDEANNENEVAQKQEEEQEEAQAHAQALAEATQADQDVNVPPLADSTKTEKKGNVPDTPLSQNIVQARPGNESQKSMVEKQVNLTKQSGVESSVNKTKQITVEKSTNVTKQNQVVKSTNETKKSHVEVNSESETEIEIDSVTDEQNDQSNKSTGNKLTLEQAQFRKRFIQGVNYTFTVALAKGNNFLGQATVNFNLTELPGEKDPPLFLEFFGKKVNNLRINGKKISSNTVKYFQNGMIILNQNLKVGENTVRVHFFNRYRNDGNGLHSLVDKVDGKQYLYTDFEPAYSHYVFPVFDQPDLRASFRLRVVVPHDWNVISNQVESPNRTESDKPEVEKILARVSKSFNQTKLYNGIENKKFIVFERTDAIATYLYAMIVGPYEFVSKNSPDMPPMRIFMRDSIIKKVPQDLIEEHFFVTQQGMKMYKELFGMAYPFNKYDQIFVPEYNSGAMENVGAVTFNENTLRLGSNITLHERMTLANVNLHELAHHWFGDLVTMKWWNDLWLNESFATYMSYLVQTSSKELSHLGSLGGAWMDFMGRKFGGIAADSYSSTHPVRNDVKSLAETESIFDGISYGKGASFLKQVTKVLGKDSLSKALVNYFQKFQWQNAEYSDLIQCFEEEFKLKNDTSMGENFNFSQWSNQWLQSSGVNILVPEVEYNQDQSIKNISIKQEVDKFGENRLRKSKFDIGVFDQNYSLHVISNVVISEDAEVTQLDQALFESVKGIPVKAIVLNHDDHAYAKVHFDNQTMQNMMKDGLQKFDEPLTRMLVLMNLWHQMFDGDFSSNTLFHFLAKSIPEEKDESVLLKMLEKSSNLISDYLPTSQVNQSKEIMFDVLFNMVGKQNLTENTKNDIIGKLHSFMHSEKSIHMVRNWLETGHVGLSEMPFVQNRPLSQKQQYDLVKSVCSIRNDKLVSQKLKQDLLEKVAGQDKSLDGEKTRIFCKYAMPDLSVKQEGWSLITSQKSDLSAKMREEIISAFQHPNQQDLVSNFTNGEFFDKFYEMSEGNSNKFFKHFYNTLMPKQGEISDQSIARLKDIKSEALKNHASNSQFQKEVQNAIESLERYKKIRLVAQTSDNQTAPLGGSFEV